MNRITTIAVLLTMTASITPGWAQSSLPDACRSYADAMAAAHAPTVPQTVTMAMVAQTVDEAMMCKSNLVPSNAADLVAQAARVVHVHVAPYQGATP